MNWFNQAHFFSAEKNRSLQILQLVFLGMIAFSTGGILVWLILSNAAVSEPEARLDSKLIKSTGNQSGLPLPGESGALEASEHLPDINGLSPQMAAATLGNWSFDHKIWSKAAEEYEKAISLGLDNPDLRTDLGSAYRFAGKFDQALIQYSLAQSQNPQHENSLFDLASLYLQNLRQPGKAIELLQQFKARFPQSGAIPRVNELIEEAKNQSANSPPDSARSG
jgi:tetratricopeptide (TPR) repeat protein